MEYFYIAFMAYFGYVAAVIALAVGAVAFLWLVIFIGLVLDNRKENK